MSPEVMSQGKLSTAADVYSLGVLMWQFAVSPRPWPQMSHTQVGHGGSSSKGRIVWVGSR